MKSFTIGTVFELEKEENAVFLSKDPENLNVSSAIVTSEILTVECPCTFDDVEWSKTEAFWIK